MAKIRLSKRGEDPRKGKTVKSDRSGVLMRKSIKELPSLYERYYNAKKAEGRAKGTLSTYSAAFRLLFRFLEEREIEPHIDRVHVDDYRDFINWMAEEYVKFDGHKYKPESSKTVGISARTRHGVVKILRNFYDFLIEEGLHDANPLNVVKNVQYLDKEIDVLTPDELRALLGAVDQRTYPGFRDFVLMTLLLDSMVRINEAVSIRKQDVDVKAQTVYIRAETTKTKKSRTVPIQKRTARLIKELIEEVALFETEYVFLANYGEPLATNHFRKQLGRYAERAGIKRNVHPHLFRHTGATMFLEGGGDIRHLQMILGHADLRMVMRYTHLSNKSIADQHEKYSPLNNVIGKLNKPRKTLR